MTSEEKAFLVTGAFEGGGYTALSGNFDGQGISFGFLQWNLGQGTLQPLLKAMHAEGPKAFTDCCLQLVQGKDFTDLSGTLLSVCEMERTAAIRWAAERQDSGGRFLPHYRHWVRLFKDLGSKPGFQAIQRKFARPYMTRAWSYMTSFGFKSERALVLLFDICVQMGSITEPSMRRYREACAAAALRLGRQLFEHERLPLLVDAVVPQAGRWGFDVRQRKSCIVAGTGVVHGHPYHLERDFEVSNGLVAR